MNKEKISYVQFNAIIFSYVLGNSIIYSFGLNYAQRETWIAELMGLILGIAIIAMTTYIVNKYPLGSVDLILEKLMGKVLAKVVLISFFIFAFSVGSTVLTNIQSFMRITIMPNTPGWLFIFSMVIVTAFIVRHGVEVLSRCSELIMPIIVFSLLLLLLLSLRLIKLDNYLPMFTQDIASIFKAAIPISTFPYMQLVMLFFFAVLVNKKTGSKKHIDNYWGLLMGGFILFIRPILKTGIFGVKEGAKLAFPLYSISRQIGFGHFLERVEIIFLGVWFFAIFIKLGVCIYVCCKCIEGIFKTNNYSTFALPVALLMIPFAMIFYGNYQEVQLFLNVTLFIMTLIVAIVPFLLTFFVSLFKKKKSISQNS